MSGPYDRVLRHYDYFLSLQTAAAEAVFPPPPLPPSLPDLAIPGYEYDSVFGELQGHTSSGCSSHVDSPTSNSTAYGAQSPALMQRTLSSHSLINRNMEGYINNIESDNSYGISADSLQQQYKWANYSIFESMNRAAPYSPEEKKERIERYRSKRNLRNFNKKIKYECRKTLADSRPRVRGRFARNDEIEKASECEWDHHHHHHAFEEEDEGDDYSSWITILDALNQSDALISSFS